MDEFKEFFEEWIKSVNAKMKSEKRKINLLVNTSVCNVVIQLVLPNLTCLLQPLDQCAVNAVKQIYPKLMSNSYNKSRKMSRCVLF